MFFHALTFTRSKGSRLNMRPLCNETNICDCYSYIFYLISIKSILKTLIKQQNIHFLTLNFSKQNGVSVKLRMSICCHEIIYIHNGFVNKSIGEMISQGCISFPCNLVQNNSGLSLGFVKLKAMFKQHVNLMI